MTLFASVRGKVGRGVLFLLLAVGFDDCIALLRQRADSVPRVPGSQEILGSGAVRKRKRWRRERPAVGSVASQEFWGTWSMIQKSEQVANFPCPEIPVDFFTLDLHLLWLYSFFRCFLAFCLSCIAVPRVRVVVVWGALTLKSTMFHPTAKSGLCLSSVFPLVSPPRFISRCDRAYIFLWDSVQASQL